MPAILQCPRDRTVLGTEAEDPLRYRCCDRCGGVWIPGGGLQAVRGAEADARQIGTSTGTDPEIECPECRLPLRPRALLGCTVDLCDHCRGLWLDPGEAVALREWFGESTGVVDFQRCSSPVHGADRDPVDRALVEILWAMLRNL